MENATSLLAAGSRSFAPPGALHLMRLPGEFGLIIRCSGELSLATAEALRRELGLVEGLDHPVLMLNLSRCEVVDAEGLLTVLKCYRRLRERGRRLIVITGARSLEEALGIIGIEKLIASYPTEEAAALDLRGWWPMLPAPDTWAEALVETIAHWKLIQEELDRGPHGEVLHLLTSMTGLCERAEQLYQDDPMPNRPRCQFCPLFHRLGGGTEDVGCRSLLDPIVAAVRVGHWDTAHAQVEGVIHMLQSMPMTLGRDAERVEQQA
jgi:anti-anti-sigma factor